MAGTRHSSKHNGHGPNMPRRERLMRDGLRLDPIGVYGVPSWPKAEPAHALMRAWTHRQWKAERRLREKGGAEYLNAPSRATRKAA